MFGFLPRAFPKSRMAVFHLEPPFRRKWEPKSRYSLKTLDSGFRRNGGLTLEKPCFLAGLV